jgi:general secretion pathway protein D
MTSYLRLVSGAVLLALVSGCSTGYALKVPVGRLASTPSEQPEPVASADESVEQPNKSGEAERVAPPEERITILRSEPTDLSILPTADPSGKFPANNRLEISAEGMPARNFANYVFGELLKVNYVLVDGAPGLDQPISLSAAQPISSRQLYQLATELLIGVGLGVVEKEGVYFIGPADAKTGFGLPIGYGRRAEDVPNAAGQILQIVPSRFGMNMTLMNAVRDVGGAELNFDTRQSAFFVTGTRTSILRVLDLLRLFDQPAARSSRVGLINLTFVSPSQFVSEVTTLLSNEGILVGQDQLMTLVPVDRLGSVVVFAANETLLRRLEFWANQIDRAGEATSEGYFVFQPKYSRANDLGNSVAALIGSQPPASGQANEQPSAPRDTRSAIRGSGGSAPGTAGGLISVAGDGVRMTVDPISNALIFFTSGPKYAALVPLVRRLDRPPKQVLLEATIAEVTLTGEFAKGVEFAFTEGKFVGGTLGSLGLPSGGFALNFTEGIAGEIRAKLQESNSQVNVLSSPILMVRDGFAATIKVGNDVPTVGAVASDPIQSDRIVSSVQYRQTGLDLSITPTINAEGAVSLSINQSITSTVPGSSGVQGAPIFFARSVETEVVASSGQSVLIGGLMSETESRTAEMVPGLGRLPVLGSFFSSTAKLREKTELVLLITPRVVESPGEWSALFRRFADGLRYLSLEGPSETERRSLSTDRN